MKKSLIRYQVYSLPLLLALPAFAQEEKAVKIGGHIRANYSYIDWEEPAFRDGLEFESLRLNLSGEHENFSYKGEYRWYENTSFNTVRYADVTYKHDEHWQVTGGITKVPFGLLPFNSNNFWFSANYYIGFEDDYDAGAVVNYKRGPWEVHGGYFLNDEYNDAAKFERYSFDVADDGEFRNKEDGQYNLRVNYTSNFIKGATTDIGASYQRTDILNFDTLNEGTLDAWEMHLRHVQGDVKIELQYTDYKYDLAAPEGQATDRLAFSGFAFPVLMASEGSSYVANLVYTLPYEFKSLTPVTCYSEYSRINPDVAEGRASSQWVNGCSFGWSKLYVYVDAIRGKNKWFSGGPGLALDLGGLQDTTNRLNISLGVYF